MTLPATFDDTSDTIMTSPAPFGDTPTAAMTSPTPFDDTPTAIMTTPTPFDDTPTDIMTSLAPFDNISTAVPNTSPGGLPHIVCFSNVSGSSDSSGDSVSSFSGTPDTSLASDMASAMDSEDLDSHETDSDGRPEYEIEVGFLRINLDEANERIRNLHFVIQDAIAAVRGTILIYQNLNRVLDDLTYWNDCLYDLQ